MKFLTYIGITIVAALGLTVLLPWWSAALAGFISGFFFSQSGGKNFLAGFIALFLVWAGLAWWIASGTDSLLPQRIAEIFMIGSLGPMGIIAVTGLIGGLTGGLGAWAGGNLRKLFAK
jgi:hypothetical protein